MFQLQFFQLFLVFFSLVIFTFFYFVVVKFIFLYFFSIASTYELLLSAESSHLGRAPSISPFVYLFIFIFY